MPRSGAGVYTLPVGLPSNGDTSNADEDLRAPLEDVATDLNTPRPILAGGTGADNAVFARKNLGINSFKDLATLLANTTLSYSGSGAVASGSVITTQKEGFSYEVASSTVTDHHLTTAGGVKLYVFPDANGACFDAFGAVGDGVTNDAPFLQAALNAVLPRVFGRPGAIYKCNSDVLVPSNRSIDLNGARIRRGYAASWVLRSSLSFSTWDNEEIHLRNIWIDDDGTLATRGNGLCMVGDRITIDGYRNTMSAPPDGVSGAWATFVSGKDITIRRLFVNTEACGLYSDGFHAGYLENFTMTDFHIRAADDGIALQPPPAPFSFSGKDLPSRNIDIQGGFVSSVHSNGVRIGAWGVVSTGGPAPKATVTWSNVKIDLTLGQCGSSCIEMVDDRNTSEIAAGAKSTDINIKARVETQDNPVRIINIKGNPDLDDAANLAQRNYGRVRIDIDASADDTTTQNIVRAGGFDYLELGGTLRYFDGTSPTLTNMFFSQGGTVVFDGVTTQGRTSGTFCNFKWIEDIELVNVQHLVDGTNEFQTFLVTITPEVGTSFRMRGGRVTETARTIVITGTGRLKDFIVSGTQLEGTNNFPLAATFSSVTWDAGGIFSFNPARGLIQTVANLPGSAVPVVEGHRAFVTDANATTFASLVAAGGANKVPVYRDGTSWRIG